MLASFQAAKHRGKTGLMTFPTAFFFALWLYVERVIAVPCYNVIVQRNVPTEKKFDVIYLLNVQARLKYLH